MRMTILALAAILTLASTFPANAGWTWWGSDGGDHSDGSNACDGRDTCSDHSGPGRRSRH